MCSVFYLRKALLQGLKPCLFISSNESKEAATVIKMQGMIRRKIIIALKTTLIYAQLPCLQDWGKRRKMEVEDFKASIFTIHDKWGWVVWSDCSDWITLERDFKQKIEPLLIFQITKFKILSSINFLSWNMSDKIKTHWMTCTKYVCISTNLLIWR